MTDPEAAHGPALVETARLRVSVRTGTGDKLLLKGVDFQLKHSEIHGLVGESGCGKSLFARTLVRLEAPATVISGYIRVDGREVADIPARAMAPLRGKVISLLLQEPAAAMDPVFTLENQFKDALTILAPGERSMAQVYDLLDAMGIPAPRVKCRQYPHQWSRGMLQRAQLAMALLPSPKVLILDEVTSALDPTIALQIVDLIVKQRKASGTAFILITHDLAMAAHVCDRISVMHEGKILETGLPDRLFTHPKTDYTRQLVSGMTDECHD